MKTDYDYIVLGCGGIGSGALYWLARRAGRDVLGIEQFDLFHHNGGSQDRSRIIRLVYHKAQYARLAPHAYAAWATVAEESGIPVVTQTGGVILAAADHPATETVRIYANCAQAAGTEVDWLTADELRYRYPQFKPQGEVVAFYQAQTGLADPQRGNASHIALARGYGVTIHEQCPVTAIESGAESVMVQTKQGGFTCRKLIVTAGAWTSQLCAALGCQIPTSVTQEQVTYYATPHLKEFTIGNFPVWQWKGDRNIYGFPVYGEVATKAAIDNSGDVVTPDIRTFEPNHAREAELDAFLQQHIPNAYGPKLYTKTCLYTMPPDRDFILDALPEHPNIIVAVGAGHAYKFASLLGQILSQLAIDGQTPHDISAFTLNRSGITNPETAQIKNY